MSDILFLELIGRTDLASGAANLLLLGSRERTDLASGTVHKHAGCAPGVMFRALSVSCAQFTGSPFRFTIQVHRSGLQFQSSRAFQVIDIPGSNRALARLIGPHLYAIPTEVLQFRFVYIKIWKNVSRSPCHVLYHLSVFVVPNTLPPCHCPFRRSYRRPRAWLPSKANTQRQLLIA